MVSKIAWKRQDLTNGLKRTRDGRFCLHIYAAAPRHSGRAFGLNMTPALSNIRKSNNRELLLCLTMVAWIVVVWGFLIAGAMARKSGEQEFPALARASLQGYFFTTAAFLLAPVIGGFSALRLVRSAPGTGFPPVIGWLLLALFALVFSFSCIVCWVDYHRYATP